MLYVEILCKKSIVNKSRITFLKTILILLKIQPDLDTLNYSLICKITIIVFRHCVTASRLSEDILPDLT